MNPYPNIYQDVKPGQYFILFNPFDKNGVAFWQADTTEDGDRRFRDYSSRCKDGKRRALTRQRPTRIWDAQFLALDRTARVRIVTEKEAKKKP